MKFKAAGVILSLLILLIIASCVGNESIEFKRYYSIGATVYQFHCQNCHGAKGEGLSALIPPLTDSAYLRKSKLLLACYLQSGMKGPVEVNSKKYDDSMPAAGINNMKTAQVLTYITNSFGNKLGLITEEDVERDLIKCK